MKLPNTIGTFVYDEANNTICYKKLYEENIFWSGDDYAKCTVMILLLLFCSLLAFGYELSSVVCRYIAWCVLATAITFSIVMFVFSCFIKKQMWEEKVKETETPHYEFLKSIYQASRGELWIELNRIREKDNPSIAEKEYYKKYKDAYTLKYPDGLAIPLWSFISPKNN